MKYFINYASGGFFASQNEALYSAKKFGFESIGYNDNDIDDDFKLKYNNILNSKRGAGYWIWKPYIILDMLNKMSDGDYLIYMDSGAKLVKDPSEFIEMIDEKGILAFSMIHKQYKWTKGDCFFYINKEDKESFKDENQLQGTYIFFRKCDYSISFVKKWLEYCTIYGLITDDPNKVMDNFDGFIDHRHDQSIFSLLSYNENIKFIPQIDQYCIEHGYDLSRKIVERHGIRN